MHGCGLGRLADRRICVQPQLVEQLRCRCRQPAHVADLVGDVLRRHDVPQPMLQPGLTQHAGPLAPGQRLVHIAGLASQIGVTCRDAGDRVNDVLSGEFRRSDAIAGRVCHSTILPTTRIPGAYVAAATIAREVNVGRQGPDFRPRARVSSSTCPSAACFEFSEFGAEMLFIADEHQQHGPRLDVSGARPGSPRYRAAQEPNSITASERRIGTSDGAGTFINRRDVYVKGK